MSDDSVERKARNEAIFRDANEKIRDAREEIEFEGKTPFLCECEDPHCRTIVRLSLEEYEAIRAHPRRFVIADGHATTQAAPVADTNNHHVVEKYGTAGEI